MHHLFSRSLFVVETGAGNEQTWDDGGSGACFLQHNEQCSELHIGSQLSSHTHPPGNYVITTEMSEMMYSEKW